VLERFRLFLERPLDPSAGRAILALAAAILLGLALLFVLAGSGSGRRADPRLTDRTALAPAPEPSPARRPASGHSSRERPLPRQDPQDRSGAAAERASEQLRTHRALQHVPYRRGRLRIELAGARGGKALLRVSAPTAAAARRGWRTFLRRYRDSGRSYAPVFEARRGARGGGA
jgi:hypothetical protein